MGQKNGQMEQGDANAFELWKMLCQIAKLTGCVTSQLKSVKAVLRVQLSVVMLLQVCEKFPRCEKALVANKTAIL